MSNMKKIILLGLFAVSIFALSSTKEENQKRKEAAFKKVNNIKTTNTNKNILMEAYNKMLQAFYFEFWFYTFKEGIE